MRLRKSSLITKLLILAVMIYAIVTVVTLQPQISDSRQQAAALQGRRRQRAAGQSGSGAGHRQRRDG